MNQTLSPISQLIWQTRYRYANEPDIEASWQRVAQTLASAEPSDKQAYWQQQFFNVMRGFRFLPGGRILAGAGTRHEVTLCNCFVMGRIEDDMESIFDALKEGAITMQQGGGVGYDFSTLRPAGSLAARVGGVASGPVSFMRIWDSMCATLLSTSNRRGAMMGTLRCDHPDISTFVNAKRQAGELRNFNLSVLVSDAFMQAVEVDATWPLIFPIAGLAAEDLERYPQRIERPWSGSDRPVSCAVMGSVSAWRLWQEIMRANYDTAEPGVLFIDQIMRENNLNYWEQISATNPCGEIPLPAYGACDLGSINLMACVLEPFSDQTTIDLATIQQITRVAIRMLDNAIELSCYPLPAQREQAQASRRIGLGITGLADALILLGLDYRSTEARNVSAELMRTICHTAYRTSIELAREKAPFPSLQPDAYLTSPFIQRLPPDIKQGIAQYGIRNSHLIAIAPAGTISLLAGNLSSGIEPAFKFNYQRWIKDHKCAGEWFTLSDPAFMGWSAKKDKAKLPDYFVTASDLKPEEHLAMQSAVQPFVDNAVSKTVNVPAEITFDEFKSIYEKAWKVGLKGCTTFRPNLVTCSILSNGAPEGSCLCPNGSNSLSRS